MRPRRSIGVVESPKVVELEDSNPTLTARGRGHLGLQRCEHWPGLPGDAVAIEPSFPGLDDMLGQPDRVPHFQ